MIDDMNEELNNNNIIVVDSMQEEESTIDNDYFDSMQIDALKEDDVHMLKNIFASSITQSLFSLSYHSKLDFSPTTIYDGRSLSLQGSREISNTLLI